MSLRSSRLIGIVSVLAMALTACTLSVTNGTVGGSSTTTPKHIGNSTDPIDVVLAGSLVPFDACDSFVDHVASHAVELVGPYGLGDGFPYPLLGRDVFTMAASAIEEGAVDSNAPDYSGTNVQVLGVDEPDMVKTDGRRIVVLSEGTLIVADVSGIEPRVVGRLSVGDRAVQSIFLSGDTLLLFGSAWSTVYPLFEGDVEYRPAYQTPTIELIEVDISDKPQIVRSMTIDGRYISARMIEDSVRLVLTSPPVGFEWSYPKGTGLRSEREAIERNKEIIRNSTPENWIPYYVVTDAEGDVTGEGSLIDCDRVGHPKDFAGVDMLTLATIDLSRGLALIDATGVLATGDEVYASSESLYVATQNWDSWQWAIGADTAEPPDEVTTEIHKFDISRPDRTEYLASGQIRGYLLNQFAMDERNGMLRVASTTSPTWWGEREQSESLISVLEERSGELVEIGSIDGLGETEQIYSVRFIGDVAYVVTFRQTDPLYTIDLSNPASPRVAGELKILGYSAYLHPVGNGLLLGVGQDATESGRVEGTQLSLFDVSDISDPRRIDQIKLNDGSNSQVEYDHHAFLFWERTGLAMVPVQQWWWDGKSESAFFGAVGLTVTSDGRLEEVRRLAHPGADDQGWDYRGAIVRSIVIGEDLYTVSAKGIMRSDLGSLREEAWLGF